MSLDSRAERQLGRLERTLRFYRSLTVVLILIIIVLAAVVIVRGRTRFARAIRIDGQIVCLVKDMDAAKRVHELLLTEAKGELPGEAALEQQWLDESWPVDDKEVLPIKQALDLLRGKVNVLVDSYVIEVDGIRAVNLPTKEVAEVVLDALKASYVNEGDKLRGEQTFLEEVKTLAGRARTSEITTDIHAAVRVLSGTKREKKTYTVKKGDFPEKIASAHGMKVQDLFALNPNIRGRTLQPGQKLTVAEAKPAITVRTVKEITRTREFHARPPVEERHTSSIPRGETQVAAAAVPGEKLVRVEQIYHNDVMSRDRELSGQILKPASPKRVLVGTGDRPTPPTGSGAAASAGNAAHPAANTRSP
jgi:LysM repeat protein